MIHIAARDQANHTNHLKITVQTVYISNESATLVDVYFDDIKVTYTPGRVIQGNEYYPFGLQTATSWTRENNLGNNFLYNGGTELNKTTQVYDLYYRNYDPVLGRFGQIDPMASKYGPVSPYHFAGNNPVVFNDPMGDEYGDNSYMDNWDRLINSPYTAGRGNSVYRDMDPYGRYTTARIMAQSMEALRVMREAQDSDHNLEGLEDGVHSFVNNNGSWEYSLNDFQTSYSTYGASLSVFNEAGDLVYTLSAGYDGSQENPVVWLGQLMGEQTQDGPEGETWYYVLQGVHSLAYRPSTNTLYEINHPTFEINGKDVVVDGKISWLLLQRKSQVYSWKMSGEGVAEKFWDFRDRPNLMLAPIYVANPSAAVAFFEENIGGEYPYHVTGNNCQNYVFNGLRAGEAEITFPFIFIGRWNDPATTPTIPGKH